MTMRETALRLASQGFKVFPLRPGAKSPPLVESWPTVATADAAQVEAWWAQWPEANVGIHCDGLVVLDVDAHKGGFDSLAALKKEIALGKTLAVQTPRGGLHIIYRSAAPVANGVDVIGRGVDVRSRSGYIVGAGSRTADGVYQVRVEAPLAEISPTLLERLGRVREKPREERKDTVKTDTDAAVIRAVAFLEQFQPAIQGQGGDHQTYRAACRVRDHGVPQERAAEALADWNSRCVPPWDADGLEVKIRNAYAYAQDDIGRETPESLGFVPVQVPQNDVPKEEQLPQQSGGLLLHPADVVEADVLHSDYLIKHLLERGTNAMLFGTWNVGKTFVVLDMAASIACGLDWFGCKVRPARVLYLGYEGLRAIKKRMIALRQKYPALLNKETPFRWGALRNPIAGEPGAGKAEVKRAIEEFVKLHGGPPDLVIIDPLQNALGGDDSDPVLVAKFNERMAAMRMQYGFALLRVHHTGHNSDERARGHSSIPADVDTNIRVDADSIRSVKQRDDRPEGFDFILEERQIGIDQDNEPVTTMVVRWIKPGSGELTKSLRQLLATLVRRFGDKAKVTAQQSLDACPDHMNPEQRRALRDDLVARQYLVPEDKSGYIIHAAGPTPPFNQEDFQ
jgi:hypothetical protein